MANDIQGIHHFGRNLFASHIFSPNAVSPHRQPCLRCSVADILGSNCKCSYWTTCPSLADFAEQAVFDGVPFESACRVMADRHNQANAVRHIILKVVLPRRIVFSSKPVINDKRQQIYQSLLDILHTLTRVQRSLVPSRKYSRCVGS